MNHENMTAPRPTLGLHFGRTASAPTRRSPTLSGAELRRIISEQIG